MSRVLAKAEVREMVWRAMEVRGVARFPGARGRIPNFVGAERAAVQLQRLPAWRNARVVKINPDAPQLPVRRMALREGKVVYMAVPRLRTLECFLELDPARLGPRALQAASSKGARVGKGGGFSDLEYGLLAETGRIGAGTVIVTTVHALQMVPQALEMLA